jgi:hypothetical protein
MASTIDETIPPDNVKASKSDVRQNFARAKSEIEALQRVTALAWRLATGQTSI